MAEKLNHEAGSKLNKIIHLDSSKFKKEEKEESKTQAQILVGQAADMELFYDEEDTYYAKVEINGHYEVWPIRSQTFKRILTARFMDLSEEKDKVPGAQAMEDALRALEAKAYRYGTKQEIHIRTAETDEAIYLDLCNDKWQAVRIDVNGWEIINNPPVYFKRARTMGELPTPSQGGNIDNLKPFINYRNEDEFKLIIAWLLSTMKEKSPFPILNIQGEQGSSKSTTTKVLRTLIDPSSLPLRALPKEEKDLAIGAKGTWILAFDNLSGMSNEMSDALCKLSTGGGLATRKLFTDDEEAVFNIMRPAILNGIDDIAKRQDLLDRSIILNLPSIPEEKRTDEKTFWKEFNSKKAEILGALCDVASKALKELHKTRLDKLPRMADFALWITAAEKALGWDKGEFMKIYTGNREEAIDQGLESDPFASSVILLLKVEREFIGNSSQLLGAAGRFIDDNTRKSKAWPKPQGVRNRLRRLNPAFKKKSIKYIEWESKKHKTLKLELLEEDDRDKGKDFSNSGYYEGDDLLL